jgi:DNA-directed RNA polymerase specialized sigma24 family protein
MTSEQRHQNKARMDRIYLRLYERGMTYKEVGEIMEVSPTAAAYHIRYARSMRQQRSDIAAMKASAS